MVDFFYEDLRQTVLTCFNNSEIIVLNCKISTKVVDFYSLPMFEEIRTNKCAGNYK
jgi:hypothetical protein